MPPDEQKSDRPKDKPNLIGNKKNNVSFPRNFRNATKKDVEWANYSDRKRKVASQQNVHRVGPAPKDEWEDKVGKTRSKPDHIGNLDCSDMEDECEDVESKARKQHEEIQKLLNPDYKPESSPGINLKRIISAGSQAIVIYFSRMSTSDERVDYDFLHSLIRNGAEVNVSDKFGQTVFHEVARSWNIDVARFLMNYGGNINQQDRYGRTPLHLAAASNHTEMVDYLLRNGANPSARTIGEKQTVFHFAAKYNAVGSLKVLVDHKVNYNVKDYKGRTPLFVAAEMGRIDSAQYLLDIGVAVGVFDDTGMSCIGFMIEKMPHVACEALNQFHDCDVGRRKDYFYLNYLEGNPMKWMEDHNKSDSGYDLWKNKSHPTEKDLKERARLACPTTPLELAVRRRELKVIMHPAMQQLIKTKWDMFGKYGASATFLFHLVYVIIWSVLAFTLPRDGVFYSNGDVYWRLPLEAFSVILTFYFIFNIIWKNKIELKCTHKFGVWIRRQINRDIQYCHPRWAQEKTFLENELDAISSESATVFRMEYPWNILEIPTFLSVFIVFTTRVMSVQMKNPSIISFHYKSMVFALIFLWLHFMKSCRPFTTLGIFITMLGYALKETLIFAGMFFIFCIPYTIGFWVLFGNRINSVGGDPDDPDNEWNNFNDILFFSWQVTVNVKFDKESIMIDDRIMSQMMLGTFYGVLTMLMINLYIALLTETFYKVYTNAKAHASREQANTILNVEKLLSKNIKKKADEFIQDYCGPLETNMEETEAGVSDEELWSNVCRGVLRRLELLRDVITGKSAKNVKSKKKNNVHDEILKKYEKDKEEYDLYLGIISRDQELFSLQQDLYEIKCAALKVLNPDCVLPQKPVHIPLPAVEIKKPALPVILQKNKLVDIQNKPVDILNKVGDDTKNVNIEEMYAKVSKKGKSKGIMEGENEDGNNRDMSYIDDFENNDLVIDNEKLPGFDHRITALMDAKLAYYNECLPSSSHVRPRNLFPLNQDTHCDTRLDPILTSRSSSPFRSHQVYPSNSSRRLYDPNELSQDEQSETTFSVRSNFNWVYPNQTGSPYPRRNTNWETLSGSGSQQRRTSEDNFDSKSHSCLTLDIPEPDELDNSDSCLLLPDSSQPQQALPTIGENTVSNVLTLDTDNALFRTIMNIKTARMRYRIEPNRQNIHRILSLINEEEQGLYEERNGMR